LHLLGFGLHILPLPASYYIGGTSCGQNICPVCFTLPAQNPLIVANNSCVWSWTHSSW